MFEVKRTADTMKVLHKKLKKVSKVKRFFYNLTLLAYIGTFIYFIYGILRLKGIEDILRYIAIAFFGIWFLIYFLIGLVTMISKKTKTFVVFTLITLLFTPIFVGSSYVGFTNTFTVLVPTFAKALPEPPTP